MDGKVEEDSIPTIVWNHKYYLNFSFKKYSYSEKIEGQESLIYSLEGNELVIL